MFILGVIVFASVDAWQPTINTIALVVLALVGNGQLKKHRRKTVVRNRNHERRLRRVEDISDRTEDLVKRIETLLDEDTSQHTSHLH